MGLFGDQGRLASMWGSISAPRAQGQGASPPNSTTTPKGGSSDRSWFAPRRFSDKIALQKKRQEDLERTLLEVEAQPACVIDASLANHPAAQRQLQFEQQQRHLQEVYIQQQAHRLPNIAPLRPAPAPVPYNMHPVPLVPEERSHAAAGQQWGGHAPQPSLNHSHQHAQQAQHMQYGHHQHQQFQHQQHSHVDHMYNNYTVPDSQEHITSPLAEPVFDHDSDYGSRSDVSAQHLSMSCNSSNNSSSIGGSLFTIDSLLSSDGPRQASACSSVDGFNAAYQGPQLPSASGTATPYGKPSFRDRAGSARVQRPSFSRSDSYDMAIASRRSSSLKVHSHRYRSLSNIPAQPETIGYEPMATAPALPVPMPNMMVG